jgi:hypothetical protein
LKEYHSLQNFGTFQYNYKNNNNRCVLCISELQVRSLLTHFFRIYPVYRTNFQKKISFYTIFQEYEFEVARRRYQKKE